MVLAFCELTPAGLLSSPQGAAAALPGYLQSTVRELERRARGSRWPACEAEAKRPHMKFTKQFCGAVPVQAELRKYRAALARAPNDAARAPIRAAIAAYEAGRIYR